jgi:broad specificity phosphatase PhoE
MTPPRVYFIRHGQTDWNAEGRYQGQADTSINDLGRRQADRNGRLLAKLESRLDAFDFVASPLSRTVETMRIARAAMGLDPDAFRTDPRLMELHFGDWQGRTMAEVEARAPGSEAARGRDKWRFLPPGKEAESYEMLAGRVEHWFGELAQPTVCATHGGVIRCVFRLAAGLGPEEAGAMHVPQDRVLVMNGGELEWRG